MEKFSKVKSLLHDWLIMEGIDADGGLLMSLDDKTMNMEEVDRLTEKYKKISKVAAGAADITSGIPVIGGLAASVASSISHLSKNAANTIQRKNPNKDNWYFILPSSGFYDQVFKITEKIMLDSKLQEKYIYSKDCYKIEIWDDFLYRLDNNQPTEETDISYYVLIEFNDDKYSHGEVKNVACSITIEFKEKFKQINFEANKVYSAFEIISHGHTPSEKRKYSKLSEEMVVRLCNNLY